VATELASTSARKLAFEQAQLEYLQKQPSVQLTAAAKSALQAVTDSYRGVADFLTEFSLNGQYVRICRNLVVCSAPLILMLLPNTSQKVARLSSSSAVAAQSGYLNRALHIASDEGVPVAHLVHAGAMQYLHSIRRKVDAHDFLVVDVILQDAAVARIAGMLLTSTVWFDATNGAAFAAHHDDGLAFKTVHTLVQVYHAVCLLRCDCDSTVASFCSKWP
jgi:hypothetical protein